jgi:methionyl-tRNA synthetase
MRTLITAALPYANGPLHLGHIRSTYLPGDICVRYNRLIGNDALYICATDEHGTPIEVNAGKEGKTPAEFVKYYYEKDKKEFADLGFSFDIFYHTESKENIEITQDIFNKNMANGYIEKKPVKQFFCEKDQMYLPDRYIKGTCPFCGEKDQYGDQCEKCGRTFGSQDLKEPYCAICRSKPIIKTTDHYFFKLSKFKDMLKNYLDNNDNLQKEVKAYISTWVNELIDWDISRNLKWGIPIPNEKDMVFYVWFDAPIGYISSTKALTPDWEKYWKGKDTRVIHFIGKDIIYHHYLFWPAMLSGTNDNYSLPYSIPTRGHLTLEGKKFSKSRGWFITLEEYLAVFPPDYLRYYTNSITPYSLSDADFSLQEFKAKINNELIANYGNFVFRVENLLKKSYDGKVPDAEPDSLMVEKLMNSKKEIEQQLEGFDYKIAMEKVMAVSADFNKYISDREPWKQEGAAKETTLATASMGVVSVSIMLSSFIPFSAQKVLDNFGMSKFSWNDIGKRPKEIKSLVPLFKKVEDADLEKLIGPAKKRGEELKNIKEE